MTKRRGKRRSRRPSETNRGSRSRRGTDHGVELALRRAERWIDRDRPEKALDLLEPLTVTAPDNPGLHHALGYARSMSGDVWGGLAAFEKASLLSDDPEYLVPLAGLYAEVGLPVHALRIFREIIDRGASTPLMKEVRETVASLEQDLAALARHLERPADQVEQGEYDLERGQRAMMENDYQLAVLANRRAAQRLGDWPPPLNNLSQALFYHGKPEEALREVRRVLENDPDNLQALANGVRFLAWSGREKEARELWARLKDVVPRGFNERSKKAEAAAILAEHESVYQILKPLAQEEPAEYLPPNVLDRARYFLAVAEANTGRRRQAERRLTALEAVVPSASETLEALRAGQSGTGLKSYFRYFHLVELMPRPSMDELFELLARQDEMSPRRFGRRLRRFVERFPQIVLMAEKMIWEERQAEAGTDLLSAIGTPEAYDALRHFGLSQAGSDRERLAALTALVEAGEIGEGETVRAWVRGEWREIELRIEEAPDDMLRESEYAPQIIDALNRALTAYRWDELESAERLFEQVLELDPSVKEAYNNLATIYARRGEHQRAKRLFRKALEIDPQYVFPCCNLAAYLLDEEQVEEAEALLAPLSQAEGRLPPETAFYNFTRARIFVQRGEYQKAEPLLEAVLELRPDYEPAQDLLEWIDSLGFLGEFASVVSSHSRSYWEKQRERDRAWRERLQQELSTLEPTLMETLPLYTRASLTETAREVMPWGGWSQLRKAELIDAIVEALKERENLARIVDRLSEEEQEALRTVLAHNGAMPWDTFDARYDNDLEESRHWEFHVPETTMGRLRLRGLLVEATVDNTLYVVVPVDLRADLRETLD